MSGGSYNYFCFKIEEFANEIETHAGKNAWRLAFADHLRLVARAAKDIEWVDSGDCGEGDEDEAIKKVISVVSISSEDIAKARAFDEVAKWFKMKNP